MCFGSTDFPPYILFSVSEVRPESDLFGSMDLPQHI